MTPRSSYQPNANRGPQFDEAVDKALTAAAQVVTNDVRLRFRNRKGGYTTGMFAHPGRGVSGQITQSAPHAHAGTRRVLIGTNAKSPDGAPYPLFWEIGHHNIFTRRFERIETFRPALADNAQRVRETFWRVFRRLTQGTP